MSRAQKLARRRAMLVAECSMQRTMLVAQSRQLGISTGLINTGDGMLQRLKKLPGWVGIAVAVLAICIPGRFATVARGGLMLWQLWRNVKSGAKTGAPGGSAVS